MGQIVFAVYDPPGKGMPFLAVRIDDVKTQFKKVQATAAKTRADAVSLLASTKRDLRDPDWRHRAKLAGAYGMADSGSADKSTKSQRRAPRGYYDY